ncbi:MAG: S8 family serine peptidase [Planctomycetota bacterium]
MHKTGQQLTVILLVLLVVGFLGGTASAQFKTKTFDQGTVSQEYVAGEILVKFKEFATAEAAQAIHDSFGTYIRYESPKGGFQRIGLAEGHSEIEMIRAYSALSMVEYAELNTVCHATAIPNDTYYGYQWHFPMINMPAAWDLSTGSGVVAAILDSGVAYENYAIPTWEAGTVASGVTQYIQAPDLAGTSFVQGYDFINNDTHPNDNNSHGTHVAGTVAQTTNNNYGVAGVAYNASIMPVKVLDYTGSGSAQSLADGLYYAADHGADVVNMSLTWSPGYNPGSTVSNAVIYAYNAGVVLVGASGNADTGTVSYPAAYSQVIAVGAVRYDSTLSYYSQYGSAQELVAPGGDVTVDQNGDGYSDGVLQMTFTGYVNSTNKANPTAMGYHFFQGTSMASPHVVGVVALMIANGITGVENIRTVLHNTAMDLGATGWDSTYGYGLVDAAAAVAGGTPPPPDTTPPTPNPMTWASAPAAAGTTSITMTATTASDLNGVEYYFDCLTTGGHDSAWQTSTTYVDTGLASNTTYTYRVKARDQSVNHNETGYSSNASATTNSLPQDTTPPNPNPMTWASVPAAAGTSSITMTATTATDPSGVEYYFYCLTSGGHDSGWQSGTTYVDTGLSPATTYTYQVMARDLSANQNGTGYSTAASATTNPVSGWVQLTYDDFESGWGSYLDGGGDCTRLKNTTYAHQGSYSGDIQDNSGTASSFYYANGVDVHNPGYTQIKIEFWFRMVSMETNEDFWVQYYNGSSWQTVAAFASGATYKNNIFYPITLILNEGSYNFPTNMKIRFMCDASGNTDDVYIDEVRVSAQ